MAGVKGRSGGKAKPRAAKELSGTFRSDRHNTDEPEVAAYETAPRCPVGLKGEATKVWPRMAKLLTLMGVLTASDLDALEAYCVVYARWKDAEANLAQYGVMMTKEGSFFPSPYLRIAEDCLKQLRAWMNEFGITPSSRSRVKVEKKEPVTPGGRDWFGDSNRN